ncbi:polysaccharide lyase [Halomonas sp. M20]|uniref:polysaccharide lyase n=1 Tax=Halomonas sp. M20 TaxID=2763264 RepID=UPI001D0BCCEE|nr:hypothetical protein [Halomonas sp. M20]
MQIKKPHVSSRFSPASFKAAIASTSLLIAAVSSVSPAMAEDIDDALSVPTVQACSSRYPLQASPTPETSLKDIEGIIERTYQAQKNWGLDKNVTLLSPAESGLDTSSLRVSYPAGTSSPSDQGEGGAGFYASLKELQGVERACLRYKIRFEPGFDFVKGGKLPGLYGGDAPSGGEEVTGYNGFSMRFMWRENGQGELYEYIANSDEEYGLSVGRGDWYFPTGRWVTVEQELILNDPDRENGIARVWIDGQPILEQQNIVYRRTGDLTIDGVMFSTFFGGNGKEWRTPRDQIADFGAFEIYAPDS